MAAYERGGYLRKAHEPRFGSWRDPGPVLRQLEDVMNTRWGDCVEYNGAENMARLFTDRKSMFGAAAYITTAPRSRLRQVGSSASFGRARRHRLENLAQGV